MEIDIRITTCDRTRNKGVNYIHTTLTNFLCAGGAIGNPVSLYVSHPDISYVNNYADQFKILPATQELNGYQNYVRALMDPTLYDYLLVLEDDLDFTSDFYIKLLNWLKKYTHYLANNLVTLYTPYIEINTCIDQGKDIWKYPVDAFYGTQAILGGKRAIQLCGEYIKGIQGMLWDMAMKKWLKETNRGLVSTVPCLVQHIGVISSIHGQKMHTTYGFIK